MCASIRLKPPEDMREVTRLSHSAVWLPRFSRVVGYCVVVWSGPHVAEPTELDLSSAFHYYVNVLSVSSAIQNAFRPQKMNELTLGNSTPHLHTHLVPRFGKDAFPGRPLPWDEMYQSEPVAGQVIEDRCNLLREYL